MRLDYPIAFGARGLDFELPILVEIVKGDEVRHDGMEVREEKVTRGDVSFIGKGEDERADGGSLRVRSDGAPAAIDQEIESQAKKYR